MIISLSGLPGAGKTTIAKKLAAALGWPFYSMGNLRRQKAAERGLTLAEYNKLGETDPETDWEVDRYQTALGQAEDNFVIEGRTSWHFIPQSIKIFLSVDASVGAERIWLEWQQDQSRNEAGGLASVADVADSIAQRLASDRLRYQQYFKFDVYDQSHYDLVVDTTKLTPEQVLVKIQDFIAKRA